MCEYASAAGHSGVVVAHVQLSIHPPLDSIPAVCIFSWWPGDSVCMCLGPIQGVSQPLTGTTGTGSSADTFH